MDPQNQVTDRRTPPNLHTDLRSLHMNPQNQTPDWISNCQNLNFQKFQSHLYQVSACPSHSYRSSQSSQSCPSLNYQAISSQVLRSPSYQNWSFQNCQNSLSPNSQSCHCPSFQNYRFQNCRNFQNSNFQRSPSLLFPASICQVFNFRSQVCPNFQSLNFPS